MSSTNEVILCLLREQAGNRAGTAVLFLSSWEGRSSPSLVGSTGHGVGSPECVVNDVKGTSGSDRTVVGDVGRPYSDSDATVSQK